MIGLIEMSIVFGALLAFLVWELVSVNRALRRDAERKREAAAATDEVAKPAMAATAVDANRATEPD